MLEDFIEANNLKARIVGRAHSNIIKCIAFLAKKELVVTVFPASKRIDFLKIKKELGCSEIELLDRKKVIEATGYASEFLPPVSVYAAKVLLDKEIIGLGTLHCKISETGFLEITAQEIIAGNEQAIVGDYSN